MYEEWVFYPILLQIRGISGDNVHLTGGCAPFTKFLKLEAHSLTVEKEWYASQRSRQIYSISIGEFTELARTFNVKQQTGFDEWTGQNIFEKLLDLLEYIFNQNIRAHEQRRSRRQHHFSKKSTFLQHCIFYAECLSKNHFPGFIWGKSYDDTPNYPVILYFQFFDQQVSFHCDLEDVPDFPGKWCGYPQTKFPLKRSIIVKNANFDFEKCPTTTIEKFQKLTESEIKTALDRFTPKPIVEPPKPEPIPSPSTIINQKRIVQFMLDKYF